YLGKSGMADAFAGAGSLVILLAWVYYAAQIFLLGAEFTKVYAHRHGSAQKETPASTPEIPARSSIEIGAPEKAHLAASAHPSVETTADLALRTRQAAATLLPRVLLLGTIGMLRIMAERRLRSEGKKLGRARRAAGRIS
ncbi:MAG: YihY/virulence factor BrkB family protein, partial [Burkholderiaceae bacterium]